MRILITGASGQLGAYLIDRLLGQNHTIIAWSGTESGHRLGVPLVPVDLLDAPTMVATLDQSNPDAIIHAAAISAADAVRLDPERSRAINVDATTRIADWSERNARRLVFTSTDLVFDGTHAWNREDDPAAPILAYGRTKLDAEAAILRTSKGVVARVSLLYGPSLCGRPYFFDRALEAIRCGTPQSFFEDEHRTPLDMTTAAEILVRLAEGEVSGVVHVAGTERVSRYELMSRAAISLGLDASLVRPGRRADVALPEPRPADVSLDTSKLASTFPDLQRPKIEEALFGCS